MLNLNYLVTYSKGPVLKSLSGPTQSGLTSGTVLIADSNLQ